MIKKSVPVEVDLRGKKARIVRAEPPDKLANLVKRPGVVVGDAGRLARVKMFDEASWRKKWVKRVK